MKSSMDFAGLCPRHPSPQNVDARRFGGRIRALHHQSNHGYRPVRLVDSPRLVPLHRHRRMVHECAGNTRSPDPTALSLPCWLAREPRGQTHQYQKWFRGMFTHRGRHAADAPLEQHIFVGVATFLLALGLAYASLKLYDIPVREWLKEKFLNKGKKQLK